MIEAIVLAAGRGTRMGAIKPLLSIEGKPALSQILWRIRSAGVSRPILVLGESARRIEEAVDLRPCRVVVNTTPERGLSQSLDLGLRAVSPGARGVLIFQADMPFLKTETIRTVLRAATEGVKIAAPHYRGERGFPVYFHRSCFPGLLCSLSGDSGGRAYIDAHRDELTPITVDDAGCVRDIDRPTDLAPTGGDRVCATDA